MVFGRSIPLWPADLDRRPASTARGTGADFRTARRRASSRAGAIPAQALAIIASATERNPVEGPDLQFTEAVIDNGDLGRHVVRFESGLLARQAAGSATVYLDDDTMLMSAPNAQA